MQATVVGVLACAAPITAGPDQVLLLFVAHFYRVVHVHKLYLRQAYSEAAAF
jgi:hypothetical protein